jgi:hypothetical protein
MSMDRFQADDRSAGPARCRKAKDYTRFYLGSQRAPRHADEAGAACVVDLVFGGRIALHRHDADFMEVRRLP